MGDKKTYSTDEVAQELYITKRTLYRWLKNGWLAEPRQVIIIGQMRVLLWTAKDIERARVVKNKICKGNEERRGYGTRRCLAENWNSKAPRLIDNLLLTKEELAARLKVKVSWIYEQTRRRADMRAKGRDTLPVIRRGKELRFSWPEVVSWLGRQEKNAVSSRGQ